MENKLLENNCVWGNDWKATMGVFFTENKLFRLDYLNKNLKTYCDEYVKYMNEFHDVNASIKNEYLENGIQGYGIHVVMRNLSCIPFKLSCGFNLDGHLFLKTSVDYNYSLELKGVFEDDDENKDYYIYQEEVLSEPEIFEKEYLFQLFNTRFIQYINTIKVSRMNNLIL